jgi:hypothetical protein
MTIRRVLRLAFLFSATVFPVVFLVDLKPGNLVHWALQAVPIAAWAFVVIVGGNIIIEKGTEGFGPGRKENKLGLRGSVTGDVVMNMANLGADCLLGGEGAGQKIALACIGEIGRAGMAAIKLIIRV